MTGDGYSEENLEPEPACTAFDPELVGCGG